MIFIRWIWIFALLRTVASQSDCYHVNGDLAASHSPCFNDRNQSSCCLTKSDAPDTCMDSGLCLAAAGTFYQMACTDPTGADPSCAHFCPDVTTGRIQENLPKFYNVLVCNPNKYCCQLTSRADTDNCCTETANIKTVSSGFGYPIFRAVATSTSTASSPSSTPTEGESTQRTTSGLAIGSSPAAATDAPVSCKPQERSIVAVGVGMGVSMGSLLVGCIAVLIVMMKTQKSLKGRLEEKEAQADHDLLEKSRMAHSTAELHRSTNGSQATALYEVPGKSGTKPRTYELDSDGSRGEQRWS